MERAIADQEEAASAGTFALVDADEAFHQVILDAARNEKLKGVVAQMQLHLLRVRVGLPVAERFRLIIQDHRSISAYLERDSDLVVA